MLENPIMEGPECQRFLVSEAMSAFGGGASAKGGGWSRKVFEDHAHLIAIFFGRFGAQGLREFAAIRTLKIAKQDDADGGIGLDRTSRRRWGASSNCRQRRLAQIPKRAIDDAVAIGRDVIVAVEPAIAVRKMHNH